MRRRGFLAALGATAAAWPEAMRAQQPRKPLIGWLSLGSDNSSTAAPFAAALHDGLRALGYVEGQNVEIERRWAEGFHDRLPALAAELVDRKVDVIVTLGGSPPARAAKAATSTIPIVFATGEDPVADGTVASLGRPGGNATGISILAVDLNAKRLQLLGELVPGVRRTALLANPNNASVEHETRSFRMATRSDGVSLEVLKAGSDGEIDAAFAILVEQQIGALVVSSDPLFTAQHKKIIALAARHSIPAIYAWREYVAAGGLISYGANLVSVAYQLGVYTGRILKGAKPADLPVEQPTKYELLVNLATARGLGLTVPPAMIARADETIE